MKEDSVDKLLIQWAEERPGLDFDSLGVVVRIDRLASLMAVGAEQALADLGLTLWEYDVLSALRRQGPPFQLPSTRLARETVMSTGAITNRVDHLAGKGLVTRESDPGDRRTVIVRLSKKGRRLVGQAIKARVAAADRSLSSLSRDDRARLGILLRVLLVDSEQAR